MRLSAVRKMARRSCVRVLPGEQFREDLLDVRPICAAPSGVWQRSTASSKGLCEHLHRAGSSHRLQCCTERALVPDIFGIEHFQRCAEVIVVG
jgi:hypothetical protein